MLKWLLVVLLLDLVAFTMLLPLFPAIIDHYASEKPQDYLYSAISDSLQYFRAIIGAPDVSRYNAVFFGGVLSFLFSFLQFISCPIAGALSDLYGRKPLFLLSLVGSLLSYILWSQAVHFRIFVLSRIVGGLSKTSISLATTIVADHCPQEKRGRGMALIGACFSFGFLVGPMIGAYLAYRARTISVEEFYRTPAILACVLVAIEIIIYVMFVPETLSMKKRAQKRHVLNDVFELLNPIALISFRPLVPKLGALDLTRVRRIGLVYFLFLFLYSGLEFTLTFLTHLRFNYNSLQQGKMFVFIGLIMIAVQAGLVRRVKSTAQRVTALFGLGIIIPGFITIGFAESRLYLYTGLALYSIASGLVVPCLTTLIASFSSETDRGILLGLFRSLGSLARAIGPIFASVLFWCLGPAVCYSIAALLLLIPFYLLKSLALPAAVNVKQTHAD